MLTESSVILLLFINVCVYSMSYFSMLFYVFSCLACLHFQILQIGFVSQWINDLVSRKVYFTLLTVGRVHWLLPYVHLFFINYMFFFLNFLNFIVIFIVFFHCFERTILKILIYYLSQILKHNFLSCHWSFILNVFFFPEI